MLCILKKIRKKNRILAKTNEKKSTNQAWSAKTTNFFYDFLEFVSFICQLQPLSLTSSTTCCTKLKLWHVCRWLFINNSADVSYTLSPMFRSRMKRKRVKEIDVLCRKSVKCVFFAVPDGNSYFLYNIFLRGKICNSG